MTSNEDIMLRIATYAGELQQLARIGADKQSLLNGDGRRHGINHLNELWQMLPDPGQDKDTNVRA